jgi:hypothetical protein
MVGAKCHIAIEIVKGECVMGFINEVEVSAHERAVT